jgi:hypothetical protein
MGEQDQFSRFFVEAWDAEAVSKILAGALGVPFDRNGAVVDGLDIDVWSNGYANKEPRVGDDFIVWPLTIEISADEGPVARSVMFGVMERALVALWEAGIRVVASCDFEDELPWSGGIARVKGEPQG